MKQYCKFCALCIFGDAYYCTFFDKVLSESSVKRANNCKEFVLSQLGDVITGKQYMPRKQKESDVDENQMELV